MISLLSHESEVKLRKTAGLETAKICCPVICLNKFINNQQITILSGHFLLLHSSYIVYYTHVATFSYSLLATYVAMLMFSFSLY